MPRIEPTGHWAQSVHHRASWAVNQVLANRRDAKKRRAIAAWEWKLAKAIRAALERVNWDAWARSHLRVVQDAETQAKRLRPLRQRVAKDLELDPGADFGGEDFPDLNLGQVESMVRTLYRESGRQAWATGKPDSVALSFPEAEFDAAMASSFEQVSGIGETLRDRMRSLMRDTMNESKNFSDFARRLSREIPGMSRKRAQVIAVTEYNHAASESTLLLYNAQGIATKQWNTVGDDKVCEICQANEAQGPIGIREEFRSGDACPPPHPSCRCNISSGPEE